jgi:hypothetical protein
MAMSRLVRREVETVLTLSSLSLIASAASMTLAARLRRAQEDGVVGVRLDVLLQVLWAFEGLPTKVALMRLQRDMDADVRRDVISLDGSSTAVAPTASEVQVVCALATYMSLADVVLAPSQQ